MAGGAKLSPRRIQGRVGTIRGRGQGEACCGVGMAARPDRACGRSHHASPLDARCAHDDPANAQSAVGAPALVDGGRQRAVACLSAGVAFARSRRGARSSACVRVARVSSCVAKRIAVRRRRSGGRCVGTQSAGPRPGGRLGLSPLARRAGRAYRRASARGRKHLTFDVLPGTGGPPSGGEERGAAPSGDEASQP
jgi:hypothetical protein